jgi:hypothetical protein
MSFQSSTTPISVTDGRPQIAVKPKEKYFCMAPKKRMDPTTLSESVVVVKEGITHARSSGSSTFFAIMLVISFAIHVEDAVDDLEVLLADVADKKAAKLLGVCIDEKLSCVRIANQTSSGRMMKWWWLL